MRLRRVSWTNYRRLPDSHIDVRNHLILVGPNDSGKSSVLRAIHLCLGASGPQLPAQIDQRDFTDQTQPLLLQVVLDHIQESDRAAFPDEISTQDGETLTVQITAAIEAADPEQKQVRRSFPDAGHERSPTKVQLGQFRCSYVPAIRSLFRELGPGPTGAVRNLLSSLDLAEDREAFSEATSEFNRVLTNSKALTAFRQDLSGALSTALPRKVSPDDVKLHSQSELLDDPLATVTVSLGEGEYSAPIFDQSDGIRALSLLSLYGMSHQTSAIFCIDEPETHLHHTAQRVIASRLNKGPTQCLLATHSPAIVREMAPLDIVTMGDDRRPRQLQEDANIAELEASTRHWSHRLIEPLTARRVLLVEGPSDRIICERVGQLAEIDLNRLGVAILELDGSSMFARAYQLFGPTGFALPLYGLLDRDALGVWASAMGRSEEDLQDDNHFSICDPDLEATYVHTLGITRTLELLLASPNVTVHSIESASGVSISDLTESALSAFCRHKKRKVAAALAVAAGITKNEAADLAPLSRIVREVGSDDQAAG